MEFNNPNLLNTFLEGVGVEPDQIDKEQVLSPLFQDLGHKLHEVI